MILKKIFSDSFIYAIAPQIPKVASLFILPITTQYLTAIDYGIYGLLTAYTGLLSGVSDLGLSVVMANSFYKYPNRWNIIWRQYHFYLIVWSVFFSIFFSIFLFFVVPEEAQQNRLSIIIFLSVPFAFFNVTTLIATRFYQFSSRPLFISIVSASIGLLSIFLNLYTIAYLKLGYMGWLISSFICSFVSFALYLYPVYFKYKIGPIFSYRRRFLIKNLRVSLPVIPHNYSSYLLNSSDRLVMNKLDIQMSKLGEYNIAYIFGNYMEFFGNAIGMALGPLYTRLFASKDANASETIYFVTHLMQFSFILFSIIVALWCKEMFRLLISNTELSNAYPIAIIIIMGYAYRPYYWNAISRLQFGERTNDLWKISFVAGFINVILNFIFIPLYGVVAAAFTTFISLLYIGFSGYFLKSFKEIETKKYYPISIIMLIVFSTTIVYLLREINVTYKILLTLTLVLFYGAYLLSQKEYFSKIELS